MLVGDGGPPEYGVRAGNDGSGPGLFPADSGERNEGEPLWNEGEPDDIGPERNGFTMDGRRADSGLVEGRS